LARSLARSREFAIRSALGADRWRLIVNILAECFIVSLAGGLIAYFLAEWAGNFTIATLRMNPDSSVPYWIEIGTDWRTLLFAIAAAFFAAILAGLLPSFRASKGDIVLSLHQGGYSTAKPLGKASRTLVTAQIALSCVLLISAGLMIRSVLKLSHTDLGANIDSVLTGRLGLFETQYPDADSQRRLYQSLMARLNQFQGIESATITSSLPGTFIPLNYVVSTDKKSSTESDRLPVAQQASIAPNYFTTFKVPLIKGRFFDTRDHKDAQPVVIVNKMMAERFWPGEDVIGRRLKLGDPNENNPWLTIVGVVNNVQQDEINEDLRPTLYLPIEQDVPRFISVAIRTKGNPMRYAESLRKTIQDVDPDLPIYWVQPLEEWIQISRFATSFLATLFGIFAIAAILLAATGQYAVLAYTVNQRKREIGVRRALGAVDKELLNLFLGSGLKQFAIALLFGLPIAFGFATLISSELFNVKAFDPFTFFIVPATLLIVSMLAAIIPAKRALKIDPAKALRAE
jgi:putative ABC transport system permease protein